jgi:hypothetical protein
MHNMSRHSIHVSEVLSVTIETIEKMQRHQMAIHGSLASDLGKTYQEQVKEYMSFQLQMLKGLKLRSDSNQKRLKNEVNLVIKCLLLLITNASSLGLGLQSQVFNNITQQDNTVMKSIALLTMTFLPGTFFSVCTTLAIFYN